MRELLLVRMTDVHEAEAGKESKRREKEPLVDTGTVSVGLVAAVAAAVSVGVGVGYAVWRMRNRRRRRRQGRTAVAPVDGAAVVSAPPSRR